MRVCEEARGATLCMRVCEEARGSTRSRRQRRAACRGHRRTLLEWRRRAAALSPLSATGDDSVGRGGGGHPEREPAHCGRPLRPPHTHILDALSRGALSPLCARGGDVTRRAGACGRRQSAAKTGRGEGESPERASSFQGRRRSRDKGLLVPPPLPLSPVSQRRRSHDSCRRAGAVRAASCCGACAAACWSLSGEERVAGSTRW
jgi:hypothetical protein